MSSVQQNWKTLVLATGICSLALLAFLTFRLFEGKSSDTGNSKAVAPCNVSPATVPEIRGLRLLMSDKEVDSRFPGLFGTDSYEARLSALNLKTFHDRNLLRPRVWSAGSPFSDTIDRTKYPQLEGIGYIVLLLGQNPQTLEGYQLRGFAIQYLSVVDGQGTENYKQFITRIVDHFGLQPLSNWSDLTDGRSGKYLLCDRVDFTILREGLSDNSPVLIVKNGIESAAGNAREEAERKEAEVQRQMDEQKRSQELKP